MAKVGRTAGNDLRDHAIAPQRLAPLLERGIAVRHTSRWLQAASALLTQEEASALENDPRVRGVRPVVRLVRGNPADEVAMPEPDDLSQRRQNDDPLETDPETLTGRDYGGAWEQLEMLGIPELHAHGTSGRGVLVAVFDTGFRKDHASLSPLKLVAERDFVQGDTNTQNRYIIYAMDMAQGQGATALAFAIEQAAE